MRRDVTAHGNPIITETYTLDPTVLVPDDDGRDHTNDHRLRHDADGRIARAHMTTEGLRG